MVLIFNDKEEKAVEKIIATLADSIQLEVMQPPPSPVFSFLGLEIEQHQRRVLQDGTDISPTPDTQIRKDKMRALFCMQPVGKSREL